MEKGSMRCDANVSIRRLGEPLGTRCEIKNINSIRNIMRAIEYEAARQVEVLESGGIIQQETRSFDDTDGTTSTMRSKENANDYRYFPDPDLPPLVIEQDMIDRVTKLVPELPDAKIVRYVSDFGLTEYDANVLIADKSFAEYFETAAKIADPKQCANWIIGELFGYLNRNGIDIKLSKITPTMLGEMVNLLTCGTISGKIAKQVFEIMSETGESPESIVANRGLVQVSDESAIEQIIRDVMLENADSVSEYRAGKEKLFGFFVGQIMKKSGGKVNPEIVNKLLKNILSENI
jgi:aspartyl-tRNA(Asn)/glutamyl-tRNA(Gln) amidotransferase subunit B